MGVTILRSHDQPNTINNANNVFFLKWQHTLMAVCKYFKLVANSYEFSLIYTFSYNHLTPH